MPGSCSRVFLTGPVAIPWIPVRLHENSLLVRRRIGLLGSREHWREVR